MFGFLNKRPDPVSQSNSLKFEKILGNKIPLEAVPYILELWHAHPFSFTVARSRKTCLGNYVFKNNHHIITVNGDSNRFSFLITLVHEIAHQRVNIAASKFRKKPLPHGDEWKTTFRDLMRPLLLGRVFPEEIEKVLIKHMVNPPASSTRDPELMRVLGMGMDNPTQGKYLSEVNDGEKFVFGKKIYLKISDRRSRTLVECTHTRKRYTIPSHARIQSINDPGISTNDLDPRLVSQPDPSQNQPQGNLLSDISMGEKFTFKNKIYLKILDRRSRTLVECVQSGEKYTIPSHAFVQKLND